MYSHKNDNICVCPHCGAENNRVTEDWLSIMGDSETTICFDCKKVLDDNQSPGYSGREKKTARGFNIRFFSIVVLLSGLMIYLNHTFSVFTFKENSGQVVYEILLVLIVSSTLASGKIRQKLKHLAIWAGIFLILVTVYSYRHQLTGVKDRVLAELVPAKGFRNATASVSFPVSSDGHFYIRAAVNGIPIIFLADTGASHIVFSPGDAGKLGIKTDELSFDRFYETANGTVRGSSIRIADFRIGEIHLKEIGASINEAGMRNSLLGMTFFKRLKRYEVKNDVLTLYWRD